MTNYRWTCPACGYTNIPEKSECATCGCPVPFRASDVECYRKQFQTKGGIVQPMAAEIIDERDLSILKIIVSIPLFLLGIWPFSRKDK